MCRSDDRGFIPKAQSAALPYPNQKPNLVHSVLSLPSSTSIDSALKSVSEKPRRWRPFFLLAHTTVSGRHKSSCYSGQVDMKRRQKVVDLYQHAAEMFTVLGRIVVMAFGHTFVMALCLTDWQSGL